MKSRAWFAGTAAVVALMGLVAACAPQAPGGGIAPVDWSFKGTSVTVDDSQDEIRLFGACIAIPSCEDEPYLLNIGFRVKIGQPGSASAFVVNPRTDAPEDIGEGQTVNVLGTAAESKTTFAGVQPMDVLDLTNPANKLEIVGTYVWASEEDTVGNGLAADGVAAALEDALNDTLAQETLSDIDAQVIIDLILGNIGNILGIAVQNIPLFGLGDDVLGGGMYIGIGARGTLASAIDAILASTAFPSIAIPIIDLPPDINGGGLYTMGGGKTFGQTFNGADGQHTWAMASGPA